MNLSTKWQRIALWGLPVLIGIGLAWKRPRYLADPMYLGGMLAVQIVLVSLWAYKRIYFPLIVLSFIWAGTAFPGASLANAGRWVVLGVGAFAGAVLWIARQRQVYTQLHLAALFASVAALTSAVVSNDPQAAVLKAASLFLLFLYCSTGLRLTARGEEARFVDAIRVGCEITVFFTAAAYAVGWELWGNPNSLGAVMSVGVLPFLLWGFLTAQSRKRKYSAALAIVLCLALLHVSLSRASILAAATATIAVCIALRRQRFLGKIAFAALLLLGIGAVIDPSGLVQSTQSFVNELLYKGKNDEQVFKSRQTPWQDTVDSLKKHPWFGTGYGTSDMGKDREVARLSVTKGIGTAPGSNREHGNSYLALAEYVGLLGILPFIWLLAIAGKMVVRVFVWTRRNREPRYCGIPLATVILAGLVHAFFEDWMFAVGYYLCVFFWVCVFQLNDVLPPADSVRLRAASPAHSAGSAVHPVFAPQR